MMVESDSIEKRRNLILHAKLIKNDEVDKNITIN